MKNTKFFPLIILGLCSVLCISLGFKPANSNKSYQHLIIIGEHVDLDDVRMSIDGKEFTVVHCHKQSQGPWDMNPIINLVHQYEADGWEMQSFATTGMLNTFWLRKEK